MVTSQITGTITTGIVLTSAGFTNPVTVARGAYVSNSGVGISAATAWTIDNFGTVASTELAFGIDLSAGGSVTNAAGAGIIAYGGVSVAGGAGTVMNAGTIQADGFAGISLADGGSVTNAAQGSIYSIEYAGVYANGASASLDNLGTLGGDRFGVIFRDGGAVTNSAGASIYSVMGEAVYLDGRALGSVLNSGSIYGYKLGVYLFDQGGSVTNASGASITGEKKDGVKSLGPATIRNAGTITGAIDAVYFDGAGANRLIVDAGAVFNGVVKAVAGGANVIELTSSANTGTLSGLGSEYVGFGTVTIDSGAAWTIADAKAGFAGVTIGGFEGNDALDITDVAFATGDTATVGASDVLTLSNASGAVLATMQLSGSFAGVKFSVSGNGANGTQITDNAKFLSMITGTYAGGITLTAARYANPVTVTSTGKVSNGGNGMYATTPWTIDNDGRISSTDASGIALSAGGSVTNASEGSIEGATYGVVLAEPGSVLNAGMITGAKDAIYFKGAGLNKLIVDPGAAFDGAVKANVAGTNMIELASSANAGTLSGLGSKYLGFQTLIVDAGASWTVSGTFGSAVQVYGSESGGVIPNSGAETIHSGGRATANVVQNGGSETVSSGGSANEALVSSGGVLVSVYGQVTNTTVFAGGVADLFAGSSADATVSGGHLLVLNGAVATGVDVDSGGFALAGEYAGGTVGGKILDAVVSSGGLVVMGADAVVSGGTIQSGGILFELAGVTSNVDLSGSQLVATTLFGPAQPAVASATTVESGGVLTINADGSTADSTILNGGEILVSSGGIADGVMVSSGGTMVTVYGDISSTTIFAGGLVDQFVGSGADTTLSGGKLLVLNGAVASGVNVESGGFVLAGEYAGGTVGGKILDAVVSSGGLAVMGADAVLSGATIQSGGILFELAGHATDITLSGLQYVGGGLPGVAPPNPAPPAVATDTTVSSGGMQIVNSNGSAVDTNVLSGGEIVFNGGLVSGLSLSSGGMIDLLTFAFTSAETLSFVENGAGTAGTLTVTSGGQSLAITLLGQYAAAGFSLGQDSGAGTLVTYSPASAAVLGLAASQH
jgi:autotransporter passenger strand-loop-strand repeat protein